MAITRTKKGEILKKLETIFKSNPTTVFVNFHGLNVSDSNAIRKDLKQSGVSYLVVKKTLVKKTLEISQLQGNYPALEGELSLVYGVDLLEPARKVFSFQKKLEGKIRIQGGIFDGKLISQDEMSQIAQIPPRETLYAQFVNLINSPIQGLAIALSAIADKKA